MTQKQQDKSSEIDDIAYEVMLAQEALILDAQMAIQRVLNEKKISQRKLARILGVGESYVSQMLGESARNLTLKTIAKVMYALGETALLTTHSFAKGLEEPARPYDCNAEFGPWGEIINIESGTVNEEIDWLAEDWAANENQRSPALLANAA